MAALRSWDSLTARPVGWYTLNNGAKTTREIYRRIDLLFRNGLEQLWRAAAHGAYEYEFCWVSEPLPDGMAYPLRVSSLRKSVWSIINDGIESGAEPLRSAP